jgi:ribose 5-phosphate isomerase B
LSTADPASTISRRHLDDGDAARIRTLVREVVNRALGPESGPTAVGRTPSRKPRPARWVDWSAARREVEPGPPVSTGTDGAGGSDRQPVAIGSDHGAFRLKQQLKRYLEEELRYPVIDCGTHSEESVDYPDIARDVALAVAEGRAWRGIVLDAMGIGSGMAANRISGALCAVCHDVASVRNAREHNDANVLSLGSRVVNPGEARRLVRTFLATGHGGGRHARRVAKIRALENLRNPIQRGNGWQSHSK